MPDNGTLDMFAPIFVPEVEEEPVRDPIEAVLAEGDTEVYTTPSDPDVKTILGRIEDGSLILKPEFQRAEVWDDKRKSRLIESLLLNLPIPPCFLAEDEDDSRVVVDGQQRLTAINDFYHGRFALQDLEVLTDLNGKRWAELPPKSDRKILQRVIRTLTISHYTHPDLRFIIFERLNTGAMTLLDQEIRNATLRGSFNKLLNDLANSEMFKTLLRIQHPDERLRHHELVLRFFALNANLENYRPPLKLLLNKFMREHRRDDENQIRAMRAKFNQGLQNAQVVFGRNAFRKYSVEDVGYETPVARSLFDLQMISLSELAPDVVVGNAQLIEGAFKEMFQDEGFKESLSRATDHRSRFYARHRKWMKALSDLNLRPPSADRIPIED